VYREARPTAWVHRDADAACGHVKTDQRQVFAAFQMPKIVDECVDRFSGMLYAPKSSARLASNVFGYELLRQTVNLSNNAKE